MRNKKKTITASQSKYDEKLQTRVDSKQRWAQLHADGKRFEIQEEMFIKKDGQHGKVRKWREAEGTEGRRVSREVGEDEQCEKGKKDKNKNKNSLLRI